jgi:hypothetical protein
MRARAFSLSVAFLAAAGLVSASGAAATKGRTLTGIDVSTRSAAVQYLRSIHVNPTGVVIQRGFRNYAGPSCPGSGWSCTTTTHPVVQVAAAGGKNTFRCSTVSCAVVQVAAAPATLNNTATCVKTTGLAQSCTINQSSATKNNVAIVYENAVKSSGLTQTASSTASITQTATGSASSPNSNTACVYQNINVNGSTTAKKGVPVNVTLEAHQTVTIKQDSAHGGNSASSRATSTGHCGVAPLLQTQTLSSNANGSGSISQNENAANSGANVIIDIEQNQSAGFLGTATGGNSVNFEQDNTLTAIANTSAGPVNQTQSSSAGGILGSVNQDSRDPSTIVAVQHETQCEDAVTLATTSCDSADPDPPGYSLSQTQFGPVHKGVGTAIQTDNGADTFTLTQTSKQDNDTGSGQTNVVQGDCNTSGTCTVDQTTTVDGQTTTNTQSGQDVNTQTTCNGSECTSTGPSLAFLPDGLSVSNTDVGEFGFGGMRGNGSGSIDVSGISGPVFRAFLYWHGPTNSTDPNTNASVDFNGTPITGTNIGTDYDNNWGFENSQSYRADVTGLVTGNGAYGLANFTKTEADVNGAALMVFYNDGDASDDRNVVLWNGNDSECTTSAQLTNWDETISGVPYSGGTASLDFIVSDGQTFDDPQLLLNGNELAPGGPIFQGDTTPAGTGGVGDGSLWDIRSFDITSDLESGSNDLHITTGGVPDGTWDCISLVVAAANVPASAPIG